MVARVAVGALAPLEVAAEAKAELAFPAEVTMHRPTTVLVPTAVPLAVAVEVSYK